MSVAPSPMVTKIPLRVLIVEDCNDDLLLLLHELDRGGYAVSHRRVETVEALRTALVEDWQLVVSDFSLPTMTAHDVLEVLNSARPDLPCIVISATIAEESAVDLLRAGARDFVVKDRMVRLLPAIGRELREAMERQRRREAETSLQHMRERMQFALKSVGIGTWESDITSGRTICSDVLERLHGRAVGQFGATFEAFIEAVHPDDRQRVGDRIIGSIPDRTASRLEYRTQWPDGSIHWIANVGQVFYDAAGRPVRAAGVAMDITVQKTLEEQFRQAQRMESIGNLAGGIAHDFNNLLTAILGYSNFLLEELTADQVSQTVRGDLEEIRKAGERAAALTSQLLAFSRKQIIRPTVLNINTIVRNLESMLRRLIGEDIELMVHLSDDLGSSNADVGQIEQVIMNLVVNSRDAMPTGGKITIETANVDLDDAYARKHIAVVPGPHVMIAVTDTGTGMTPDVQARIFEPFFTTKPKDRGTGLGLATVYGIVKQNAGNIWVYSEVGRGTTFKVYLPRVTDRPGRLPQTDQPVRGGNETVLLVEDDERVRRLAREMLARNGYHVIETSESEEALRAAAGHPGPLHLLLTDVVMPGMSGRVLAQRLVEQDPDLKILYMSGYTDNAIVNHGILMPGVAFLQKPFTPTSLARAVREVLDDARQLAQPVKACSEATAD
jgi:two-component system cell cycle sensor histidine kinase/response regulator CckA